MMKTQPRYTGTKIGQVLKEQGRQQSWIASQLGVSRMAVSRWVNGSRTVSEPQANRIASLLGVPFSLLFELPKGNERDLKGDAA